ncbi:MULTISPECIES: 2-amino-4-hydroxy-6-hydroxymethyldihydropteridine diphosphokinase [unclassified Lysobacter]|uniref:2-amino-4-hydroxy-6- hydroxymethyldihydropteridine diphosphokinase n=1 Tax=unclassified Lysobacter TaxID=2635362 RepID=UPI0006F697B0|nr:MULTISPECIES: 2-amino-4-hydroxy-6-hydroxymethyldihydropteridine diphosphokinase [unclassified Lysobacter]KQZ67933.1 2-amino-4-hydroxy-6-hydroxymethyldihydropteridine pyrophosphokinase [Lysobacter sp. Root559]KRC38259.1 2-amino-4-hydroxy-6-hydroxymethyldihydropteridine pyrophosphokinase [Lysobacter sp. Root76]KRD69583.1 2-amino-4-hydroxy-6-hydroxymethyldihydropteridine pyrophosphokinase [Lysobacter sp. Root96]
MNPAEVAFVGLGSNLGDSAAILRGAFAALAELPGTRLLRASSLYRTPAWGVTAQPDFVNAAAMLETGLSPQALLAAMLAIEREAGRDRRDDGSDRWGPRTLDLDLLLYGQRSLDEPGLRVPHPHLHERAFALLPLLEIAPDAHIPGIGPAREALAGLEPGDIQTLA